MQEEIRGGVKAPKICFLISMRSKKLTVRNAFKSVRYETEKKALKRLG